MGVRITVSQFERGYWHCNHKCWIKHKNVENLIRALISTIFSVLSHHEWNLLLTWKALPNSEFERVWNKMWVWSHPWHILFVISIDSLKHQVPAMCWDETTPDYILLAPIPFTISYYIPIYNDYRGKYNNSGTFSSYHIIYHGMLCQRGENIKITTTLGAWKVDKESL